MTCKKSNKILGISVHFLFLIHDWNSCEFRNNLFFKNISQKNCKSWIFFDFLHFMAHFLTFHANFFQKFYFLGPVNFDQSYLFYDHETPLHKINPNQTYSRTWWEIQCLLILWYKNLNPMNSLKNSSAHFSAFWNLSEAVE